MRAETVSGSEPAGPFFVVGAARSGTTLMRFMLDSHPRLAVPDESLFIVTLWAPWHRLRHRPEAALEAILANRRFRSWRLDPDIVRAEVAAKDPTDFVGVVRAVFGAYARFHGKVRWGDKTLHYAHHLATVARLFPDARFIHMIRDGRDVAAALASYSWAPNAVCGAYYWRKPLRRTWRVGHRLGPNRYLEVRLEDLVADPKGTLTRVCDFLGERFDPAMLDYPNLVQTRDPGQLFRRYEHRHLLLPPTPGLRDWRAGLSARQQRLVEAACEPWLARLGYVAEGRARRLDRARAWVVWMRGTAFYSVPYRARKWLRRRPHFEEAAQ